MLADAILSKTKVLSQSKTVQNAAVLISGKAGVHIVALLSQPLLARLYSPAQFGEFAFFNSIMAILFIAASGRYEAGIILTKRPGQASNLFQLSQYFLIGYTLMFSLLLLLAPEALEQWLFQNGFTPFYLWAIPAMIIFTGYWQIVNNWLIRFQKFSQVSLALLIQRIVILITAVSAFFLDVPGNGLVFSVLTGSLVIFIISLFIKPPPLSHTFRSLKNYAHHFRDFPFFSVPTLYINLFTIHFPVLWITFFYSNEEAGIFSIAYSLISLPALFLHAGPGQVFCQLLAQTEKSRQYSLTLKYFKMYAVVLIPAVIIVLFSGERLIQVFLGENWTETGRVFSLLALLMLIQGLNGLLMLVIYVLRKQKLSLKLHTIQLIILAFSFSAGLYLEDLYLSFRLVVLFSVFHLAYSIYKVFNFIKVSPVSQDQPKLRYS